MPFANVIDQVATATQTQKNILTDGCLTYRYEDIPALLAGIDRYLRANGITPDTCLALECKNSVPSALTLLTLLQQRYGVVLLPPSDETAQAATLKPVPGFCQYRLTLNGSAANGTDAHPRPETFLAIEKNEQFRADSNQVGSHSGKLYLRTSGSMGASKIVVHAQAKLFGNAGNCVERFQLTGAERVALAVPIFHMYGLGAGFLPAIIAGASIDLQEKTHLLKYLERERQFEPTATFLTPALCEMLLQRRGGSRAYRLSVSAGARLKEEIIRAFDERFGPLVNLYGSTELGAVCAPSPDDPVGIRATTIGRPMPDVLMEVRKTEVRKTEVHKTQNEPGQNGAESRIGDLYCRHPYGFETYLDEQGSQIGRAETWFETGDMAKIYPDGAIQILGRVGNSVNRDGYLVLLADVEKGIENIEAVAQVVVLTTQVETKRGQQIVAFCLLEPGATLDRAQIRARCFDILPRYALPDEVVVVDVLPTLASGKVDRQALRATVSETERNL